jgi:hypothetical protein
MLRQARAHLPTAAHCLAAALGLDTGTVEGEVGAQLLACLIDDTRFIRTAYEEKP